MVYIYPEKDLRAYPGAIRGTEEWNNTYKIRTTVERDINHIYRQNGRDGRVEYLEAARQRVRNRRIRRTAVLLVLLTAVVLFATGIAGSSVAALKDLTDTARIALLPGSGWPQQTGVAELEQMAPLTGSFVELGDEGCVVWSRTGKKLNSIQSGYARPALAAGKTRFVLYSNT